MDCFEYGEWGTMRPRFLSDLFLCGLVACAGMQCGPTVEHERIEERNRRSDLILFLGLAAMDRNVCLERDNVDAAQGQTLGPYTNRQCFRISVTASAGSVGMTTPSSSRGNLAVYWAAFFGKQQVLYKDDPAIPISGPGIYYGEASCDTCGSYLFKVD